MDYPAELLIETSGTLDDLVGRQAVLYYKIMYYYTMHLDGNNPDPLYL
jgi:hypothetical protein